MESKYTEQRGSRHDRVAPFWAIGLVVLCGTGLSTIWIDLGGFWKGYVLDMTGPAWNYILFRTRYRSEMHNRWTDFFTPKRTVVLFVIVCFGIEGTQYLNLYDATYDPWDFLAYVSILLPLFLLDVSLSEEERKKY